MPSGTRLPTWRERENNKRRERRRRAIAAKIFTGLRAYGNFKLPKHCDNNEVLKALCNEAGWTVEEDGTTYRSGSKRVARVDVAGGGSASPSPCTSYQPSPPASYNPSPPSSSFPSPSSSSYITNANNANKGADDTSLIPWLKKLSSASPSSSLNPPNHHHFYMHGGSISAPVTPPLSSPTARSPRVMADWDDPAARPPWVGAQYAFLPSSTPPSPGRQVIPDPAWFSGLRLPSGSPSSPTYSLVSSNPFGFCMEASAGAGSSRMWTPGQSGTCSPVPCGHADVRMPVGISDEFAFGSSSNDNLQANGLVKPWEGERIHEECASDELELTLGSSRTRADA